MRKEYEVKGMSCAACQSHVKKALSELDGVSNVEVNLLTNKVSLDINEDIASENDLKIACDKAGYKLVINNKNNSNISNKDNSLKKLIFSIINLLVLMYFSMGVSMFHFKTFKVFDMNYNPMGFSLIQFILVLPIVIIYNNYFINGFKRLIKKSPNMDSLIAIGASVSLIYGLYSLFMISMGKTWYHKYLYFESCAMILVFVSIGKYLESISKKRTYKSIEKLVSLKPKTARVLDNGKEVEIDASDVKKGQIVILKKGDILPVDGKIIEGQIYVDQSNITGESLPVIKSKDDMCFSSTTVSSGYAKIEAIRVNEDTTISNIIKLVEEASNSKAPISRLADRISKVFVPLIITISILVFIFNIVYINIKNPSYVENEFETALNFSITVLVIACPCALGLATPVAIMVGTGKGALNGCLIKNAPVLENMSHIKTIVFDKTGTITKGKPTVQDLLIYDDLEDVNSILYNIEVMSEHPLSDAIVNYTKDKNIKKLEVSDFKTIDGIGLSGIIDGNTYKIGNLKLTDKEEIISLANNYSLNGSIPLVLTKNDSVIALISIKDQIKENAKEAISLLKKEGIKVVMLTGDNEIVASKIASEVLIDDVISQALPEDKANVIKDLKKKSDGLVAIVGDGVNDAIALKSADIGFSIGNGSDVAIDTSDVVLLRSDLKDIYVALKLSKRVLKTIKVGLFFAFFYNAICVFLATGLFYYMTNGKFKMEPMYGAIAMSLSSVSVVLNALTINLFNLGNKEERKKNMKKEVVLNVEGMMCNNCKNHVFKAVSSVKGVSDICVSLENKNVTFSCDNDDAILEVKAKINEEGYKVL